MTVEGFKAMTELRAGPYSQEDWILRRVRDNDWSKVVATCGGVSLVVKPEEPITPTSTPETDITEPSSSTSIPGNHLGDMLDTVVELDILITTITKRRNQLLLHYMASVGGVLGQGVVGN